MQVQHLALLQSRVEALQHRVTVFEPPRLPRSESPLTGSEARRQADTWAPRSLQCCTMPVGVPLSWVLLARVHTLQSGCQLPRAARQRCAGLQGSQTAHSTLPCSAAPGTGTSRGSDCCSGASSPAQGLWPPPAAEPQAADRWPLLLHQELPLYDSASEFIPAQQQPVAGKEGGPPPGAPHAGVGPEPGPAAQQGPSSLHRLTSLQVRPGPVAALAGRWTLMRLGHVHGDAETGSCDGSMAPPCYWPCCAWDVACRTAGGWGSCAEPAPLAVRMHLTPCEHVSRGAVMTVHAHSTHQEGKHPRMRAV